MSQQQYLQLRDKIVEELLRLLRQCGMRIGWQDIAGVALEGAQGVQPRLVLQFQSTMVVEALEQYRMAMRDTHGVSWRANLTRQEMANRRLIAAHPKFKAAVDRAAATGPKGPMGRVPVPRWRFDTCVIGEWGPDAEIWSVWSLVGCDAGQVTVDDQ